MDELRGYWGQAWQWTIQNAKTFTPIKSASSILALGLAAWWTNGSLEKVAVGIVAAFVSYCVLHAGDLLWKLLFSAPAAIYEESLIEIRRLRNQVTSLERNPMARADAAKVALIESSLSKHEDPQAARDFLQLLDQRPQYDYHDLQNAFVRTGRSMQQFSRTLELLVEGNLVLLIPPNPLHQKNVVQLNPEFRMLIAKFIYE